MEKKITRALDFKGHIDQLYTKSISKIQVRRPIVERIDQTHSSFTRNSLNLTTK